MSKKLYVGELSNGSTGEQRLIRASNQAQADRHLTKGLTKVKLATAEDAARLVAAGISIEDAVTVDPRTVSE